MVPDEQTRGHPRLAMASALLPPVGLIGGWTLAAAVQPGGFPSAHESISALAGSATPYRWIMTTGFVLTGIGHLLTAYAVPRLDRRARLLLGLGGLSVLGVAALPVPSRTTGSGLHTVVATVGFVALAVWPLLSGLREHPPRPQRVPVALAAGVLLTALSMLLGVATVRGWATFGLVERLAAGAQAVWPLAVASGAWAADRQHARQRQLDRRERPGDAPRHPGADL